MNYLWKEWKEQSRGVGLWLSLAMVMLTSFFILLEARSFPREQGFEAFLLSLYDLNLYLLPLLSLFLSSFSILQEKEQKTLMILLTKRESYISFLLRKSAAVQSVLTGTFVLWFFLLAIPVKFVLPFQAGSFLVFLFSILVLLVIFNQIGLFLGSITHTRLQLVGAAVFTWFLFLYLIDLVSLYMLPGITKETIAAFSVFYFLDPLHAIRMYLETSLGMLPLNHLSKLVRQMLWMSPLSFMLVNLVVWTAVPFGLSILIQRKGDKAA